MVENTYSMCDVLASFPSLSTQKQDQIRLAHSVLETMNRIQWYTLKKSRQYLSTTTLQIKCVIV